MSSIFEVPVGLLFVLSLVTTNPGDVATAATGLAAPKATKAVNLKSAPCRHSEQAWFGALKNGAGGAAFSYLSNRIFVTSGGRYYVPVAQDRLHLLQLQQDNAVSCFIALSSASANAGHLKARLGRDATLADLYLAHVLGQGAAASVLRAVERDPNTRMAALFPNLDSRVPGLYAGRGRKMTLAGFSRRLKRAVQQRVAKASGQDSDRRVRRQQRPTRKNSTPARAASVKHRLQALVQKTTLSARVVNQRGFDADAAPLKIKHPPQALERFDFAGGIGAHQPPPREQSLSQSISF